MKFVDEVKIFVEGGRGGDGCCSFRREKFVPRGGPDGGDGGNGGSVVLVANPSLGTLLDLQFHQHNTADRGKHGKGKQMTGARGKDKSIAVPCGTLVYDAETGEMFGELLERGDRLVVARGGRGGRGNLRFVSPTNRVPHRSDPGEKGQKFRLRLELKLMADVGLVGFPNVGKSTLISVISAAKPKIADYPFTTIVPNLGVVKPKSGRSFVIADIPGLIEGASDGAGLGHRFLRHVERCAVLLHLLEFNPERGEDPLADFETLRGEIERYQPEMLKKPQVAVLNKADLNPDPEEVERLRGAFEKRGMEFFHISAAARQGLEPLLEALDRHIVRPAPEVPELLREEE